jgi:hypothetical protein
MERYEQETHDQERARQFVAVPITPCPAIPQALQFGIVYAPKVPTPPWIGYVASEIIPGVCQICGYNDAGGAAVLFDGNLHVGFQHFAHLLRMDR